jgi:hypothetical protein
MIEPYAGLARIAWVPTPTSRGRAPNHAKPGDRTGARLLRKLPVVARIPGEQREQLHHGALVEQRHAAA